MNANQPAGPITPVDLAHLIGRIRRLDAASKQQIFETIKHEIVVHDLEHRFNISAQIILEAISRSSDLTRRGVRGVIAETVFILEVVPTIRRWRDVTPPGNHSYDVDLANDGHHVRVQVKMQRSQRGSPLTRSRMRGGVKDHFVVEVQRTRTGQKGEALTRPYRFREFDLLAVCMQASTGRWQDFLYCPVRVLDAKQDGSLAPGSPVEDDAIIQTMQCVPHYPAEGDPNWTRNLVAALDRCITGG